MKAGTWHEQTEAERDAVCLPFVLADGTELAWQGFARLRASELGMEPVRERVLTGNDTVVDVYRYDDIPADRRRMRMRRRAADGRVEDYEASLEISDLAVRRYKYGYNSEAGTMELPDDLMPIDLRWVTATAWSWPTARSRWRPIRPFVSGQMAHPCQRQA